MTANQSKFVKNFTTLTSIVIFSFSIANYAKAESVEDRVSSLERNISVMQKKLHDKNDETVDIEQTNEQVRNLTGQIEQLTFEVNKLNKSLEQISSDFTKKLAELDAKMQDPKAESSDLEAKIQLEIARSEKKLFALLSELEQKIDKHPAKKAHQPRIDPITAPAANPAAPESVEEEEEKSTNIATPTIEAQYKAAVKEYNDEHYQKAEKSLSKFIQKNPQNPLTAGAYFYLGEAFFMQNNFEKASINYMYCYKKFPSSESNSFIPYSMYRLGRSLLKLNKAKEACNGFSKALAYKPDGSLKSKILDEIKINHCGK